MARQTVADEAPEFRWTAVPGAGTYRLQLAASAAFETLFYDDTVDGPTAVSLEDVRAADVQTVVWRVRIEGDGERPWSTPASFSVGTTSAPDGATQFLVDAPPVPIRPIRGDAVDAAGATLTWEGVPEASGYRVQVAPTAAFDAPIVDVTLDQTTTLTLFEQLPPEQDPLHWRLCALFPNDTEGPWSEVGQFGTDPDVEPDTAVVDEAPDEPEAPAPSPERSARAAGPALEAQTSGASAIVAIALLVVSFLLTLLLILWAL